MFRASLRPSSGGRTAFRCLWFSVLLIVVVMLESRVVRCVHCDEDVACFPALKRPDWPRGPPSLLFGGYWGAFPGLKGPKLEVGHSSASITDIQSDWSHSSTLPSSRHDVEKYNFPFVSGKREFFLARTNGT
jgi:hypothetical protein